MAEAVEPPAVVAVVINFILPTCRSLILNIRIQDCLASHMPNLRPWPEVLPRAFSC